MVKEFNECTIQSDKQVNTIIDSKEHVDVRNWLRNDSAEQVDVINDSKKLIVDGSDPKSDPSVATTTTNRISATDTTNGTSTRKLIPLFINPDIQAVVRPITPLITVEVKVAQKSLRLCQTSILQANVKDGARLFWTTDNVIGTKRDCATPRDASFSKTRSRASFGSPTFVATSIYPTRIGNKDIFSPRNSSTARRGRNAEPFNASINGFPAVNEHSTSYVSGISGVETVSTEVADVNLRERMNFASNSVFGETPKFVDLGLLPAHTADKLKSSSTLPDLEGCY